MCVFFCPRYQLSGLPLKLSVKMQINMAMRDVSMMANVEKFAHTVWPMLWFEIVSIYIYRHTVTHIVKS